MKSLHHGLPPSTRKEKPLGDRFLKDWGIMFIHFGDVRLTWWSSTPERQHGCGYDDPRSFRKGVLRTWWGRLAVVVILRHTPNLLLSRSEGAADTLVTWFPLMWGPQVSRGFGSRKSTRRPHLLTWDAFVSSTKPGAERTLGFNTTAAIEPVSEVKDQMHPRLQTYRLPWLRPPFI